MPHSGRRSVTKNTSIKGKKRRKNKLYKNKIIPDIKNRIHEESSYNFKSFPTPQHSPTLKLELGNYDTNGSLFSYASPAMNLEKFCPAKAFHFFDKKIRRKLNLSYCVDETDVLGGYISLYKALIGTSHLNNMFAECRIEYTQNLIIECNDKMYHISSRKNKKQENSILNSIEKIHKTENQFYNREVCDWNSQIKNDAEHNLLFRRIGKGFTVQQDLIFINILSNTGSFGTKLWVRHRIKMCDYVLKVILKPELASVIDVNRYYSGIFVERYILNVLKGKWAPQLIASFFYADQIFSYLSEILNFCSLVTICELITGDVLYLRKLMETLSNEQSDKKVIKFSTKIASIEPKRMPMIRFYLAELLCAVHFLHSNGIVHNNITAECVQVDARGHLKLTDFVMATVSPLLQAGVDYRMVRGELNGTMKGVTSSSLISSFKQKLFVDNSKQSFEWWGSLYCRPPNFVSQYLASDSVTFDSSNVPLYNPDGDYWAIGVIFYQLLFGYNPFYAGPNNGYYKIVSYREHRDLAPNVIRQRCGNIENFVELYCRLFNFNDETTELNKDVGISDHQMVCNQWEIETLPLFCGLDFTQLHTLTAPIYLQATENMALLNPADINLM